MAAILSGCGSTPRLEPADVIDRHVHRGADVLGFDRDSTTLVSGGWEGEVALWSLPEGRPWRIWKGHDGPVLGLGFSGTDVVSAGQDGWLYAWDRGGARRARVYTGSTITKAAIADGYALTGHADGWVRVWRLPEMHKVFEARLHRGEVRAVAIHAGGSRFASIGIDKHAYVWTLDTPARPLEPALTDTRSLAFSPDGETLFGGGWLRVFRWELERGTLRVLETDHWGVISGMEYVPSLHVLATISRVNDSSVYFLEPTTGKTLRTFTPQSLCGSTVRLSPNGRFLATTGDDGQVRIWDLDKHDG